MLFPIDGSRFDMRLAGWAMALAASTVVVGWGPKNRSRRT
jgi:hypothetical protein